jgi:hypothetical protein
MWYLFFKPEINLNVLLESKAFWIYTTALIFITKVSGIMMRALMSTWTEALKEARTLLSPAVDTS